MNITKEEKLQKYLERLSDVILSKVIPVLEMTIYLAEMQYEDTFIQKPLILEDEHYCNIKTIKPEVENAIDKLAKIIECECGYVFCQVLDYFLWTRELAYPPLTCF